MKVSVLFHNPLEFQPSRHGDIHRYYRNPDPELHPLQQAREYTRALVATKLEKLFAKPLVMSLDGHTDSVKCMARSHHRQADLASGSCDGEVRMWNLASKQCCLAIQAHEGFVRGVCFSADDHSLLSCGDDKLIKHWKLGRNAPIHEIDMQELEDCGNLVQDTDLSRMNVVVEPLTVFQASSILTSIDHHWEKPMFVTSSEAIEVWDHNRSQPIHTFQWGCDVIYSAKFNPSESGLIASTAADNSVGLYDIRASSAIRKVVLKMRSNSVSWNPLQPLNFTVANEDANLYTFDMRRLDTAIRMHKDFTGPVLDVDYSPTGMEFAAASYDRTIRIFQTHAGRSRDVYHTKRMQTVLCSKFSGDGRFVLSGSADMCIRVWKAEASSPLGAKTFRERRALAYRRTLKEKFAHLKDIRRIQRHHHIPALVKRTSEKRRAITDATKKKEENRRRHAKPGAVPFVSVLKKPIVTELE